ncbi:MAG: exodeoxyribonuclease VII large subunit [Nitrospinota bacterium]|nr:exodeoxyribonuclease VII large subunit [Nitrospinota bacterium]
MVSTADTADMEGRETPFTVSEVADLIKSTLERAFPSVWIEGELSKVARPASGHLYLTLKDDKAVLDAVVWKPMAMKLAFEPEEGSKVLVRGRVTTYAPYGRYQMVLDRIEPAGIGALQVKFEQLKKKLDAKGYFAEERKRAIPPFPKAIGVVTSGTGAAFHDIVQNIHHRDPGVRIILAPVMVEGAQSKDAIAEAIDDFNKFGEVDILIVGRGGGSPESLWGFNEEIVADAISRSKIPVISAVGHEIDFTIADFVADLRAPTPSSAAVLAVKERKDVAYTVNSLLGRMVSAVDGMVRSYREQLSGLLSRTVFTDPARFLEPDRQRVDELTLRMSNGVRRNFLDTRRRVDALYRQLQSLRPDRILQIKKAAVSGLENRLASVMKSRVAEKHEKLTAIAARLPGSVMSQLGRKQKGFAMVSGKIDALSPFKVLKRGYSIARMEDGAVIKKKAQVKRGDKISILLDKDETTLNEDSINCEVV